MGGGGQRHTPASLPRERLGTHCVGGWVGPRAGLDGCIKSRPHRYSIPGPSSPYHVAILTELSWPCMEVGRRSRKRGKRRNFENKRPTWYHLLFLFHFLCAQHVSDINISIIGSLWLFCWITTLVVCSWFDVCWCFGVVGLEWYPCCRLLTCIENIVRIYIYCHFAYNNTLMLL